MFPLPPRPLVTTFVFNVGVSRSSGVSLGDLDWSRMFPAPPLPVDASIVAVFMFDCRLTVRICSPARESVVVGCECNGAPWECEKRPLCNTVCIRPQLEGVLEIALFTLI